MSETCTLLALSAVWAVFGGGTAWYTLHVLRQVTYVTLADGRRRERRLPLGFRLLLPLTPTFTGLFRRPFFDTARGQAASRLMAAGYAGLLGADEFLALRFLVPGVLGLLAIAALWTFFAVLPGRAGAALVRHQGFIYAVVILLFAVYPGRWLRRVLAARHRSIQRALPFVMDLLTLSVEAGLDFLNAIQRIVTRRELDPLGEELVAVFREIQLGKTRRDALRDMARRVNQMDVHMVVNAIVQADELGVGIGSILRIQADQMRNRRFERAEKLANEAPVKMLFPLVAFVFPAVIVVLMGPILLQIFRQL
jgi:pilus assembly protein TadC